MSTTVTISGTLTTDPTIRYSREGQATTTVSVIVDGDLFVVVSHQELAENIALSLTKGMRVLATGRLLVHQPDEEDGLPVPAEILIEATDFAASLLRATADVHPINRPVLTPA